MKVSNLLAAVGAILTLSAGAALAAECCECCEDMAADVEMSCCDEMDADPTPEPAPAAAPAEPALEGSLISELMKTQRIKPADPNQGNRNERYIPYFA